MFVINNNDVNADLAYNATMLHGNTTSTQHSFKSR